MNSRTQAALDEAAARSDGLVEDLIELIAIRSVSGADSYKDECARAAQWLADRLQNLPCRAVEIFETSRSPILFASLEPPDEASPTVLIYGHYDVQRPDPLSAWDTDPFQGQVRGEHLYGRGASDMKGPLLAAVSAVEALHAAGGLPLGVKFILEGDEETSGEPMKWFLKEHGDLLEAGICLNVDAGMLAEDQPTIVYGLRGSMNCTVRLHGPDHDLHDGMFGGVVQNPIQVLAQLIAGLQDESNRVTLPGFYESVRQISEFEHEAALQHPHGEEFYLQASGAPALIQDPDYLPVERVGARPSMNVRWFKGGEKKNAVPVEAEARISFRLVPDQDPDRIHQSLIEYLQREIPPTVRWETEKVIKEPGVIVELETLGVRALAAALEATWGVQPIYQRIGGSIPVVYQLKRKLGIDSALTGFSLPGDHIHGPNEHVHLPTLHKGVEAVIRFFDSLGEASN
jgi:acetylornithine deacetylase/succinyl-diaminopimelate desuccinylase-like protein